MVIGVLIAILVGLGIGFLINAGVVWALCWGLNAIGITSIGGWTVQFSWPLVVVFTLATIIIGGFFRSEKSGK